jgi:hypothetical protein
MQLRADVQPSRTTVAVAVALVVLNLAFFVSIAEDVLDGGGLISRDQAAFTWFVDHRSDWLIDLARFVSTAGGFVSLTILGILLILWLTRRGSPLALAAVPLLSLLLGSLASTAAKAFFDRQRPPVAAHATAVGLAAFPSAHATNAAAFFLSASFVGHGLRPASLGTGSARGGGGGPRRPGRTQPARPCRPLAVGRRRRLGPGHSHCRHGGHDGMDRG